MGFLPMARREQLAWQRRTVGVLDGQALGITHSIGIPSGRRCGTFSVVVLQSVFDIRGTEAEGWSERERELDGKDTIVEYD